MIIADGSETLTSLSRALLSIRTRQGNGHALWPSDFFANKRCNATDTCTSRYTAVSGPWGQDDCNEQE
jgi:hypothetical protein